MSEQGGDLFKGFLLGGIVGVALGVLFSPRSGKDIRENLKGGSDDILNKAKAELENIKTELNDLGNKISDTIEKGKTIFEGDEVSEENDFEAEIQSNEEEEKETSGRTSSKRKSSKKKNEEA